MYKVSRYYNGIFALMVLDVMQISGFVFLHLYNGWDAYTFLLFTFAAVGFVAVVEIKSIYEPADAKESKEIKKWQSWNQDVERQWLGIC